MFTYGTLMRGFPRHRLLEGSSEPMGTGTVRARLWDLGPYPAAIPDRGALVRGEIYRIGGAHVWERLDSAEGPQYDRREVTVGVDDALPVTAFIYWYRGPLTHGGPIPGGDYRVHAQGRR
ncbi:MAG TPA: gamma-glutamylcyclotransferase family protein [Candidatus Limnocylindrales bacterium]|nr:gamma-glutamylcyclotransferase family protein [Candidatus Limnocylindrales bacterium]